MIPSGVDFHLIGLADKDYINDRSWVMRRLSTIIRELRHEEASINIRLCSIHTWHAIDEYSYSYTHEMVCYNHTYACHLRLSLWVFSGHVYDDNVLANVWTISNETVSMIYITIKVYAMVKLLTWSELWLLICSVIAVLNLTVCILLSNMNTMKIEMTIEK